MPIMEAGLEMLLSKPPLGREERDFYPFLQLTAGIDSFGDRDEEAYRYRRGVRGHGSCSGLLGHRVPVRFCARCKGS
jgi:hypothetical protein